MNKTEKERKCFRSFFIAKASRMIYNKKRQTTNEHFKVTKKAMPKKNK